MPILTAQLDRIERSLPPVPSRIVRFQRVVAGATYDQFNAVVQSIVGATRNISETTRRSGRTVTGQARAEARQVAEQVEAEVTGVIDAGIDAVDEHPGSGTPYEQWTKAELLDRAKQLGIEGRYGLNKKQLISALRNA
jgi:hypothetical protein